MPRRAGAGPGHSYCVAHGVVSPAELRRIFQAYGRAAWARGGYCITPASLRASTMSCSRLRRSGGSSSSTVAMAGLAPTGEA